ncbi:MAG: ABC transporter permease, partial [Candidatus Eremiobacteraeota bacterium]|nr:ABC transporter permease [Candidatus Eremiobacteraeota bacterium]
MMNYFREALEVLAANRLRTILALLGLVVGVSAVIAIQVLGAATSGATAGIFQGFSDHTFIVYPNVHGTFSPEAGLLVSDVEALNSLPNVKLAIPYETLTRTAQ